MAELLSQTMAGDAALMEALTVIDKKESEVKYLQAQLVKVTTEKESFMKQLQERSTNDDNKDQVAEVRFVVPTLVASSLVRNMTLVASSLDHNMTLELT